MKVHLAGEKKVLLITISISLILLFLGIISGDRTVLGPIIILSIILVATPQLILSYFEYRRIKEIELRFPEFLRDLVEATRAGLPLHKAIILVSHNDYGPLSKEVKKMANQLSWNISLLKVLEGLQKRLKRSTTLSKIIRVMIETYKSGGKVDETLASLSNTLTILQDTQKERESVLKQYVIAMYVISIIFIVIVVAINKLLVPIFESMAMGAAPLGGSVSNPCSVCLGRGGITCGPCNLYFGVCSFFGVETSKTSCYYLALFFCMSIVQAITGGLVAGQIGEASVKAGIKHSLLLFFLTIGVYFIFIKFGLIGV